jgi:hypothetical protein
VADLSFTVRPSSADVVNGCGVHVSFSYNRRITSVYTGNQTTSHFFVHPLIQPHQTPSFLRYGSTQHVSPRPRYTMQAASSNQTHSWLTWCHDSRPTWCKSTTRELNRTFMIIHRPIRLYKNL